MMWLVIVLLVVLSAALAYLASKTGTAALVAAGVALVAGFIGDGLFFFAGLPIFVHPLDGNAIGVVALNLCLMTASAAIGAWAGGSDDRVKWNYPLLPVYLLLVYFGAIFFIDGLAVEPRWCNEPSHRALANLWNVEEAAESFHDTDPDMLLRVSPDNAVTKAKTVVPVALGSYLEVDDKPNLQIVEGHPYYILALRMQPGQWRAFKRNGSNIPGYIVVDAVNQDAQAQFRSVDAEGNPIRMTIVDADRFLYPFELDRFAYYEYFQYHSYRYDGLHQLEVDEQWRPYYTATLLDYVVGHTGYTVAGVVVFDPQGETAQEYMMDEIPAWIDIVYSTDIVSDYATWWAEKKYAAICSWANQSGKFRVDAVNDVFSGDGVLWRQVTLTSIGSDATVSHLFYVQPRTGKTMQYNVDGMGFRTIGAVNATVDSASTRVKTGGYNAVETELQHMYGEWTYYSILNNVGGVDAAGTYGGMSVVRAVDSTEEASVIFGMTPRELDANLRRAIQASKLKDSSISEEGQMIEIMSATVIRSTYNFTLEVYQILAENAEGQWKIQGYGDVENLAFVEDGDVIDVVVFRGERSTWLDIHSIEIRSR